MTDIVQIALISSAATVVSSVVVAATSIIVRKIDKYHKEVDGMKNDLVEMVGTSEKAKGLLEGNIQGKAREKQDQADFKTTAITEMKVTAEHVEIKTKGE